MEHVDLSTLPRSRKEAKALGLKHYFTGKPCPKGHVTFRFASGGNCNDCLAVNTAQQSKKLQAARRAEVLSMRLTCKQCNAKFSPEFGQGKKSAAACYCSEKCRAQADKAFKQAWVEQNPDVRKKVAKAYASRIQAEKGPQWRKARQRNVRYVKQRRLVDPGFKLSMNLRVRLRMALKNKNTIKETSVIRLVGCSLDALAAHLEAQFQPGMSWDNWTRDGWHIDHIRPIASFDKPDHPDCWHYTNLRPLWATENLKKGARLAA